MHHHGLFPVHLDHALDGHGEHQGHPAADFKAVIRTLDEHPAAGKVAGLVTSSATREVDIDGALHPAAPGSTSIEHGLS